MLVDARQLPAGTRLTAAICIIGGGPAGITLAREFAGTQADIVVIESGGLAHDEETQALARGTVVGGNYNDLEVERVRLLGGASDHWGGECCPLDRTDFEARAWVPYSGWPIEAATLEPYYRRAAPVVEIAGHERFGVDDWDSLVRAHPALRGLRFANGTIAPRIFQNSPPTRFGERYRAELEEARNVRVMLNANLVGFDADEAREVLTAARVACLHGPEFTVAARVFVLATGTIENARILLACAGPDGRGFGNDHGLVGRFFQEHVAFQAVAHMLPADRPSIAEYRAASRDGTIASAFTDAARRERQLHNFTIFFSAERAGSDPPPVRSFRAIVGGLREMSVPDDLWTHIGRVMSDLPAVARYAARRVSTPDEPVGYFEITLVAEQMPNPDSRVRLGSGRDALGMPMAELEWRLTEHDREMILRGLDFTAREIGANGLGRVKILFGSETGDEWLERVLDSHHPMGTTRMHAEPRFGVVDPNCRVHGMRNLYVAGASVFPTGGAASPTYTLVALSIRLADHLKAALA